MSQTVPVAGRKPLAVPAQVALAGVFAALIAVCAMLPPIPVGGFGVPITLQTFAVMLTGLILGARLGFLSVALYVVVGLVGLPVLSGFNAGFGVLAGPSGGYLLAFPFAAALTGALSTMVLKRGQSAAAQRVARGTDVAAGRIGFGWWALVWLSAMVGSFVFIHPMGIGGMMLALDLDLPTALAADMVFWPGDVIKNVLATAVAATVIRAFPALALRRF
ncbi:biotin transporter BioY [Citricoccus nitrophenolicus]|uniref:Biotin transporter n=1 Tax=Citricoccus muralis TaxID=169134 RepID=A0A3D9L9T0_9MICC|nr:biotin transporter BioY [Citricoccus muralis]REE03065.1 biotin transport system substrate-specific component [Citricoccus muralis]